MSGAGVYEAGIGLAGEGVYQAPGTGDVSTPPTALVYTAPERTFAIDSEGRFYSSHPIDQRVRLALLLAKGSMPADPEIGFDWRSPFERGERLLADVTGRIKNALFRSGLSEADDIETVRINVKSVVRGRVSWTFEYRNRLTSQVVTLNG